ncbi:MAG: DUF2178 domain-containing protein [Candidatus Paceibacterota bacterium]
MSYKNFKVARMLMAMFIAMTVSIAVSIENVLLAVSAVGIGMISMVLIKRSVKEVLVDEMVKTIAGKSALMAYTITVPVLAFLSLILMFSNLSSRGSEMYNLGITLSYVALFNMAAYSLAYYYYQKKYGRDNE